MIVGVKQGMIIDISGKILEIQECVKRANELKSNKLVWEPFHKDLLFRLSWNSNSLEGNTLSLEETIAVIEYDEVRSGHTYTEYQEAKSMYRTVMQRLDFEGKTHLLRYGRSGSSASSASHIV